MTWGMFVYASVDGTSINQWLQSYDLEAADPHHFAGGGTFTFTSDPRQALTFAELGDVLAVWKQAATLVPTRPDGRPNRPLTQFTVSPMRLPR